MVYWVGLSEREGFMDKLENFKLQLVILLACEILILGLLAILGMDFNFVLMMAGVVGFNVFLVIWVMIRYDRDKKSRDQNLARILGNDAKDALLFGEVGILVYDENLIVTWFNDFLADRGINLIGKKVSSWNPNINDLFIDKADVVTIEDGDYVYEITRKENSTVLYVKDVSDYEKLRKVSQEEKTVLGLIQLDNYDEVSQYEDESMNSQLNMKLRQPVFEWAKENGIVIRRVKSDRFYMVLNESIYQKILNEKFSILNIIRKNSEEIGVNVTLSMAIARGNKKLSELDETLINLMELAQNRGGDQVAVKLNDSEVKYYGGNSEATEKRSRVRVRVMAKAIRDAFNEASNVFIVGHKNMDFDCMGANLLLSRIAQGYMKNAYIISESGGIEEQCKEAMKHYAPEMKNRHHFVNEVEALKLMKDDDLVIAADFHNPDHCNAPGVLEKATKVILIDHHRRSDKFIDNPLLVYVETSASSVSELITEFLPYMSHKVHVNAQEATIAYLGILIDSNRFKARTGARTFEACAVLRTLGVDPNEAEDLIKENIEEFEERSSIMRYGRVIFDNIMIAPVKTKSIITKTMMSKCADAMLSIKGIEASFVIGYTKDNTVAVSARSKGKINVQKLMEEMNGGGHFSAAALSRENASVEEIEAELIETIQKSKQEEEENESNLTE